MRLLLEAATVCGSLTRGPRISHDGADSTRQSRLLSLHTALLTTHPSLEALNWDGDGDGSTTPKPNAVDGYFGNILSSTPPAFFLNRNTDYARTAPHSPYGLDPPRPAREDSEWVWYPEGYWAERKIGLSSPRKSGTPGFLIKWRSKSTKSVSEPGARGHERSSDRETSPLTASPRTLTPSSPYASEEAHVASLQHPLNRHLMLSEKSSSPSSLRLSYTPPENNDPTTSSTTSECSTGGTTTVSVTCITAHDRKDKRWLRLGSQKAVSRPERLWLSDADYQLKQNAISNSTEEVKIRGDADGHSPRTSTSKSVARSRDEHRNSRLVKKWFGKAAWHRKESGTSTNSVKSTVRELLASRTPPVTPAAEADPTRRSWCFPGPRIADTLSTDYFNTNFPGGVGYLSLPYHP